MNATKQEKDKEMPAISPLAQDKTYGERKYEFIFDNMLNYWTNLLASAGFSHWAANSTKAVKIPGLEKAQPREIQNRLGSWISKQWFMDGYKKGQLLEHGAAKAAEGLADGSISELRATRLLKKAAIVAEQNLQKRGFAMAESLTLLVPGFAVMIPSVWLGAKIKPWLVEHWNKKHYGADAMDDPSLKARHQAIEAEVRPTLLGTIVARVGTVGAVQLSAKFIGSESNTFNWIGKRANNQTLKNFQGINPVAEAIGGNIGNSMPKEMQTYMNQKARSFGFSWSDKQIKQWKKKNPGKTIEQMENYNLATQDLAKYISMDTIYTLVSAGTIHPFLRLLKNVPGMAYKPKVAANSPEFDGEKVVIKSNPFTDSISLSRAEPAANDPVASDLERSTSAANDPQFTKEAPSPKVREITGRATLAEGQQHKIA